MKLLTFIGISSLLLEACSSPALPTAGPANNPLAPPAYSRPDSLPRYFPTDAGENPVYVAPNKATQPLPFEQTLNCFAEYELAAQCLAAFRAPVLRRDTADLEVYRLLLLRSFDQRPILLTLTRVGAGGLLQTCFLNRAPGMTAPVPPDPDEAGIPAYERTYRREAAQRMLTDSNVLAEIALAKAPVRVQPATHALLSSVQCQQFKQLLNRAGFWQLPSCQPNTMLDGAEWFLEVQEPGRYHVVHRHGPRKEIKQCCEFLLRLSSARHEKWY